MRKEGIIKPEQPVESEDIQQQIRAIRSHIEDIGWNKNTLSDEKIERFLLSGDNKDAESLVSAFKLARLEKISAWARLTANAIVSALEFLTLTPFGPDEILALLVRTDLKAAKIKKVISKIASRLPDSAYETIDLDKEGTINFLESIPTIKEAMTPNVHKSISYSSLAAGTVLQTYWFDTVLRAVSDRKKFFAKLSELKEGKETLESSKEIEAEEVFSKA